MAVYEDWTPDLFATFSPRNDVSGSVQQKTDTLLNSLYNNARKRVDIGQYSSAELKFIQSVIHMELLDIQSALAGNTSGNADVHNEHEDAEDSSSSVDGAPDTETDSDVDYTSNKYNSNDYPDILTDQTDSSLKTAVEEDSLNDRHAANLSNAFSPSQSKCYEVKHEATAQSLAVCSNPCPRKPSKSNSDLSKQKQLGKQYLNKRNVADNWLINSQCCCKGHSGNSVSGHLNLDTVDKHQWSKVKAQHPARTRSCRKNQEVEMTGQTSVALCGKAWHVRNIAERCSLFNYKKEILNQQNLVHHGNFLMQVSLLNFSLLYAA